MNELFNKYKENIKKPDILLGLIRDVGVEHNFLNQLFELISWIQQLNQLFAEHSMPHRSEPFEIHYSEGKRVMFGYLIELNYCKIC